MPYYGPASNLTGKKARPPGLTHRANADGFYAVNTCPEQCSVDAHMPPNAQLFMESRCDAGGASTGWTMQCGELEDVDAASDWSEPATPPSEYTCRGNCKAHELCYNTGDDWNEAVEAWCVSRDRVHQFLATMGQPDIHRLKIEPPPNEHGRMAVEVILTQESNGQLFTANYMVLQATDENGDFLESWNQCRDCSRLAYGKWPPNMTATILSVEIATPAHIIVNTAFYEEVDDKDEDEGRGGREQNK